MSHAGRSLPARGRRATVPWRGWGWSILVVTALLLLFEAGHRWLETRSQTPLFRVIVAGESLSLDAWLETQRRERLIETSGIETALAELQADYPRSARP